MKIVQFVMSLKILRNNAYTVCHAPKTNDVIYITKAAKSSY